MSTIDKITPVSIALKETTNAEIIPNRKELFVTKIDPISLIVKQQLISNIGLANRIANVQLKNCHLRNKYSMVGKNFLDFCHPEDRHLGTIHILRKHL